MKPKTHRQTEDASGRAVIAWHELNRKQRRDWTRRMQAEEISLQVVHPAAAGIDIGNEAHYVAVRHPETINRCGALAAQPLR
jgi:hypothetical protein